VISPIGPGDWAEVARIYEAGIEGGNATFESAAPSWREWSSKRDGCPGILAREGGGAVTGWAALSPVSARECYRGVGSISIYVDPRHAGRGIGRALLTALIALSEDAGFWTLEAGIFPENLASIALHQRLAFRFVGTRSQIGRMPGGAWRDVLLYERRSELIGRD
jgi:L-amino acid N-acyltransferase YncA